MVEIKLGGEMRQLQFSHKAIKALQSHYGPDGFKKINTQDIQHLDTMIWACLLRYNKGIDLEEVEDMIADSLDNGECTYEDLTKAIEEVISTSHIANDANIKKKTVKKAVKK